jgi:hypothetical protein
VVLLPAEVQENGMSFQGHIENGLVVLDEPLSLPNGTVVRVEPVEAAKEKAESWGLVFADTDQPYSIPLSLDPDDYPLF